MFYWFYFTILCLINLTQTAESRDRFRPGTRHKVFSFASYYGDHMVLQRGPAQADIWGYITTDNQTVQLQFNGKNYSTYSHPGPIDGVFVWKVKLEATVNPGPYVITATSNGETISLRDVLFGDVWICSGQSNMAFTLSMLKNASAELKITSNYSHVRVFTAAVESSTKPLYDLKSISVPWSPSSPRSLGGDPFTYFSAVCWLYGKALYERLRYPIGLIESCVSGTPVEYWMSKDAFTSCNLHRSSVHDNSLWNAMINPLLNMTIYGSIWYQGESNAMHNRHNYNCTFPAMIADWRLKFSSHSQTDHQFPFGFVQLAPDNDESMVNNFPEIRWHQTADYGYVPNPKMNNVFMAVAIDLPDSTSPWGSIHPRYKYEVVNRLTLSSLAVAYKMKNIRFQGPFPTAVEFIKTKQLIRIVYDDGQTQLQIRQSYVWDYQIYCGYKWSAAPIIHSTDSAVYISSYGCISVGQILYIRYNWSVSPCLLKQCAIYDSNTALPAPPFILKVNF